MTDGLCGLEACDLGGFCQARSGCPHAAGAETDSAVCDAEGCYWTASGPRSGYAGGQHWLETAHPWTLVTRRGLREVTTTMSTLHEDDDLLTPSEVAALFSVDPKTVTRWTKNGKITAAHRTLGGHRRYRYGEIRAALEATRDR